MAPRKPAEQEPAEVTPAEPPEGEMLVPLVQETPGSGLPVHHYDTYATGDRWGWRALTYDDVLIHDSGLAFISAEEALQATEIDWPGKVVAE
jgi:hypothetical protein